MSQGLSKTNNYADLITASYDSKEKTPVYSPFVTKEVLGKSYGPSKPIAVKTKCTAKMSNCYRSDHNFPPANNLLKLSNNVAVAHARQKNSGGAKEIKYGS